MRRICRFVALAASLTLLGFATTSCCCTRASDDKAAMQCNSPCPKQGCGSYCNRSRNHGGDHSCLRYGHTW